MTTVFNKKSFIAWCEENIQDEQAIIVSTSIDGELKIVKRRGIKVVPLSFSSDVFKAQDGIGDIYFGKVKVMGLGVCDKEELSEIGQGISDRS